MATHQPAPDTPAPSSKPSGAARRRDSRTATAVLSASAFVLAGMLLVKAGDLPAHQAHGATANMGAGFTMTTASNGLGPEMRPYELLYLIDNRSEILYIYEVDEVVNRRVILRGGGSLPALFRAGRGR